MVRDWLIQVEGQLDELEGRAGIRGGEDDPASIVHHRDVCCQNHLKSIMRCKVSRDDDCLLNIYTTAYFKLYFYWLFAEFLGKKIHLHVRENVFLHLLILKHVSQTSRQFTSIANFMTYVDEAG